MSEYYAEHESIEDVGTKVSGLASELDESAAVIGQSSRVVSRSRTLEGFGYTNLIQRTQSSVTKLSGKTKEISSILGTVSALYADYEGRVIAALDDSVSAGNNYSRDSRHQVRDQTEQYASQPQVPSTYTGNTSFDNNGIVDYTNPTPEQKRMYTHQWLEQTHPELLEQIYDRLHGGGGVAAAATTAGLGGAVAAAGIAGGAGSTAGTTQGAASGGATNGGSDNGGAGNGAAQQPGATSDTAAAPSGVDKAGADPGAGAATPDVAPGAVDAAPESDWVADMLNDAVDSDLAEAAQQAQGAIADAANPVNGVATSTGGATLADAASMDFATNPTSPFAAFLSQMGDNLAQAVQKYGVNAGILAGGAGVVYASSGVAIEAVAHCAEFVATKCMPGVNGMMQQVTSAVRVTRISIRTTMSNIMQGVSLLVA